jgi:hypothetical protein
MLAACFCNGPVLLDREEYLLRYKRATLMISQSCLPPHGIGYFLHFYKNINLVTGVYLQTDICSRTQILVRKFYFIHKLVPLQIYRCHMLTCFGTS